MSTAISIDHVSKKFRLYHEKNQYLKTTLLRGRRARHDEFWAVKDVSFDIPTGSTFGIIGSNGSGKSTLLKCLAGILSPDLGTLTVNGRLSALLELGAGFHPDLSGRENIFLNGAILGMTTKEIQTRFDDIVEFAGLGTFIDTPVKNYSSGMVVRLGFAVATSVTPEVLITDEVLAVGDESFQKKCMAWMERYLADGGTLLLCSHSMYHIQKLCQQALWLHGGRVQQQGSAADVTRAYLAWHEERDRAAKAGATEGTPTPEQAAGGAYQVKVMRLNGQDTLEPLVLPPCGELTVSGAVYSPDGRRPQVAVGVVRADGTPIYGVVSEMDQHTLQRGADGLYHYAVSFQALPLLPGRYIARSHAMDPEGLRLFDHVERPFEVSGSSRELGYVHLAHTWADLSELGHP